jgi:16S rRNA (cytosine967-C5)-methyltransferase
VRIALQIGLFQMIFLDRIPPHSAINESVELVSRAKKTSAKSFVNALLRSYQRRPHEPTFVDEVDKISISTSHPRWLVERWISQFGFDEAERSAKLTTARRRFPFGWLAPRSRGRRHWLTLLR